EIIEFIKSIGFIGKKNYDIIDKKDIYIKDVQGKVYILHTSSFGYNINIGGSSMVLGKNGDDKIIIHSGEELFLSEENLKKYLVKEFGKEIIILKRKKVISKLLNE